MIKSETSIKPIAFYLPQYHTIAENDKWWGDGFTEWTNVKKARPLFKGHYQPHVPLSANYYDLQDPAIMEEQAILAKAFGIHGFCFYHYWFNGKLLLEAPLHKMLESKRPDFPFCLSWANENWTRRWDGADQEILIQQNYSKEDDLEHIKYLMPFFKDNRYIKIDNKPVFLMYRSELHPSIKEATEIWRREAVKAGFDGLFLIRTENFLRNVNPVQHGFDAGLEFAPDITLAGNKTHKKQLVKYAFYKLLHNSGLRKSPIYTNRIVDYSSQVRNMINREIPEYTYFRCVCPSWDNSARRKDQAIVYHGSSPEKFEEWLKAVSAYTGSKLAPEMQFFFINAWNEWGEGCHLEPDEQFKFSYLEAVKNAVTNPCLNIDTASLED